MQTLSGVNPKFVHDKNANIGTNRRKIRGLDPTFMDKFNNLDSIVQNRLLGLAVDHLSQRKKLPIEYCDTAVPGMDDLRRFELPLGGRVVFHLIYRDQDCFLDIRPYPAIETSSVIRAAEQMKLVIDSEYLREELEEKGHSPYVVDFEVAKFLGELVVEPIDADF